MKVFWSVEIQLEGVDFIQENALLCFVFRYEGNRLLSFSNWPSVAKAFSFQLCQSGFFYEGVADEVTCFACGGKFRDWEVNITVL